MNSNTPHRITREKLDHFPIPVGGNIVLYDQLTRKALFYKKQANGYVLKNTYNKRSGPIMVRAFDYILTMGFDGVITAGDSKGVFVREAKPI